MRLHVLLAATVTLGALALALAQEPDQKQQQMEKLRKDAAAKASNIRKLEFTSEVAFVTRTKESYGRKYVKDTKRFLGDDLTALQKFLGEMGYIPPALPLEAALSMFMGAHTAAYYDKGVIGVLSDDTPSETLLVHELTHALEDQNFGLDALSASSALAYDPQLAIGALIEGDAEIVELFASVNATEPEKPEQLLKDLEKRAADTEASVRKTAGVVPLLFPRSHDFVYRRGIIFVETLRQKGGWKAVNAAYASPPKSTEQILHPEKYLAGEQPAVIDTAPLETEAFGRGYRRRHRNVIGELGLLCLFETFFPKEDLSAAAAGWAGDAALLFENPADGGKLVLAWVLTFDSDADAAEFGRAYVKVLQKRFKDAVEAGPADAPERTLKTGQRELYAGVRGSDVVIVHAPLDLAAAFVEPAWKCLKGKTVFAPLGPTHGDSK